MLSRKKPVVFVVAVSTLLCVLITVAISREALARAFRNATQHQPAYFTELYLTERTPKSYKPGVPLVFSFVVHNREASDQTYAYKIFATIPEGKQSLLKEGRQTLGQGQSIEVSPALTVPNLGSRVKISVELTKNNQQSQAIHRWTERSRP